MAEYNGWTNYETWLVSLTYGLCDHNSFYGFNEDALKEYVEDDIEATSSSNALELARCALSNVNWKEIADTIERNRKAEKEYQGFAGIRSDDNEQD